MMNMCQAILLDKVTALKKCMSCHDSWNTYFSCLDLLEIPWWIAMFQEFTWAFQAQFWRDGMSFKMFHIVEGIV
jgi:hypothetical protein